MMPNPPLNCFEESSIKNQMLPAEWQDQDALDELSKFLQLNWEQRSVFFDDGEVTSCQQFLGFIGQKGIRTNNYIGTIVFKGRQLNIFPKVFREDKLDKNTSQLSLSHLMKNLVQWLKYCDKISYPFISITSKLESSDDLFELFVTLYLNYVKRALEYGPYYRYEDKEENISVVRGHIDFKDYISRKIPNGLSDKFLCSYSEFEFDNIVNRIIKYTCNCLAKHDSISAENKKIIRQVLIRFNEVSDVRCVPSDCDSIRLSKMQRQYSVILSMSKMFLLNQTTAYTIDNQESFCFLFPTELLFEGFIGGFIQDALDSQATVKLQASEMTLIDDILYDGESLGKAFAMRHDIRVEHKDRGIFILDTKYKHMARFEGNPKLKQSITEDVSQTDLYQVIEYAAHEDLDAVYLLYPMYRFEDEEPKHVLLKRKSELGTIINIHVFRMPFVFEDDTDLVRHNLEKTILRIFS